MTFGNLIYRTIVFLFFFDYILNYRLNSLSKFDFEQLYQSNLNQIKGVFMNYNSHLFISFTDNLTNTPTSSKIFIIK